MVLCWHSDARPLDLCGPSLLRTCGSTTFFSSSVCLSCALFVFLIGFSNAVTRFVAQPASVSNMFVLYSLLFFFVLFCSRFLSFPFVLSNNLSCCQARANDYTHLNRCSTLFSVFFLSSRIFFFCSPFMSATKFGCWPHDLFRARFPRIMIFHGHLHIQLPYSCRTTVMDGMVNMGF